MPNQSMTDRELERWEKLNALKLIAGKTATTLGDTLINPKTVLTWLLTMLGAPGAVITLLVPIRESGSMLPQLFISGWVQKFRVRKWIFVGGSVIQAAAVAMMGLAALWLEASTAGIVIVLALGFFATARAFCSISSKDVMGRSIPKGFRGRVGGLSTTISGILTAIAATCLILYRDEAGKTFFSYLLLGAAGLWLIGGVLHAWVYEPIPEPEDSGKKDVSGSLIARMGLVTRDSLFRDFIIARSLLLGTALAAPLFVVLGHGQEGGLATLIGFIVAGAVATSASSFLWGKLADRASHLSMAIGGGLSATTGLAAIFIEVSGIFKEVFLLWPILFLLFNLGYAGVRMGRKTWVVDAAKGDRRTNYVSASNTLIAIIILILGGASAPLQQYSVLLVLGFYVVLSFIGAGYSLRLKLDQGK